jgi:hypothetical protein
VRVLDDYRQGQPVFHEYCIACAETAATTPVMGEVEVRARMRVSTTCLILGLTLGVLALAADYLGLQGHGGFGWAQSAGLALGALLFATAALLRVDLLGLLALGVLVFSLIVDVARVGESAGMGWKQNFAAVLAALLLTACLIGRWRRPGAAECPPAAVA